MASYAKAPSEHTPFHYQPLTPHHKQSSPPPPPAAASPNGLPPVYFTVENELVYHRFNLDFGPLHIGHVYCFSVLFRRFLSNFAHDRRVVFWSKPDPKSRANAACLLACYMIVVQNWPPQSALKPIGQADPPLMPFRDPLYTQADFTISVQDVVFGVWRAKKYSLCGFRDFNYKE